MFFTSCQSDTKPLKDVVFLFHNFKEKIGALNKLEVKIDSNTVIGHPTISPDEQFVIFQAIYRRTRK